MSDRERLIKLLDKSFSEEYDKRRLITAQHTADYLLANGVILPPCKVDDTVYVIGYDEEYSWIDEYKVKYFYCSSKSINRVYIKCGIMGRIFRPKDIGKTVFLTREEAEKALAERQTL